MKLNKYQNDTQIRLALFLQVLVHNFLSIRILKDLSLLKSFHKISGIHFKWPLLRDIPELVYYLHCRLCLCFILFNASHIMNNWKHQNPWKWQEVMGHHPNEWGQCTPQICNPDLRSWIIQSNFYVPWCCLIESHNPQLLSIVSISSNHRWSLEGPRVSLNPRRCSSVGITRSCHLSDIITSHQSDSHLQNLHLQHLVYILHWYMELLVEASPGLKLHWLRLTFPAAVGGLNLFPLFVALVLPPKALDLLLSLLWKLQSPYPKW